MIKSKHVVCDNSGSVTFKYVFDKDKINEYLSNYDLEDAQCTLYKLSCNIANNAETDAVIDTMYKYVTDSIQPNFLKKRPKSTKNTFPTNRWFDEDCKHYKEMCE